MNQMYFSNQMGMGNNMNNYMSMGNLFNDANAIKVKNLIEPYEQKIKELEEKLRQKEFEIACLKNKLNEKENENMMSQMNHMNIMNQMMMNQNDDEPQIDVYFQIKGINSKRIKCSFDEMIISVINKYCRKTGVDKDNFRFIYNGKKLNESLTVAESGLSNNSNIYVIQIKNNRPTNSNENNNLEGNENKSKYNISFSHAYRGKLNIVCNIDDKLADAIKKYGEKININFIESFQKNYSFLYNASKIHFEDLNKTIGQFFKLAINPVIIVYDTQNLIGN